MIKCVGSNVIVDGTKDELCVILVAMKDEIKIDKLSSAIVNKKVGFKIKSGFSIVNGRIDLYEN